MVDVSAGLSNPTRILYPKVAKKTTFLDDFLARRLQLKSLEERRIEMKYGPSANKNQESPSKTNSDKANTATNKSKDSKEPTEIKKEVEDETETKTIITSDLAEKTAEDKEKDVKKFIDHAKKTVWNVLIPKINNEASKKAKKLAKRPNDLLCYSAECVKNQKICYSMTCINFKTESVAIREAVHTVDLLLKEAKEHGFDVQSTLSFFDQYDQAVHHLQDLVKNLMKTKDEAENELSIGISAVPQANGDATIDTTPVKKESETSDKDETKKDETKKEDGEEKDKKKNSALDNVHRVYSSSDSTGKLYLKRIQTVAESKKQSKIIKYPLAPSFYAPSR